jgi:adenine-specific DNA-methyltransferase
MSDLRVDLIASLAAFGSQPLTAAACRLFATLGYQSKRTMRIASVKQFCEHWDTDGTLTAKERTSLNRLSALHFLFQLTDAELGTQTDLFTDASVVDGTRIHSYLFLAVELPDGTYSRTDLTAIARALNKPLKMPALVLFKHGDTLSLAVLHRRLNKVATDRDVLEKATLIKDIRCAAPHRAHVEILADLAFESLCAAHTVTNFVQLHAAWRETLDIQELNKRFYRELQHWYFWALGHVRFPEGAPKDAEDHDSLSLIRLLTRLIFVWFLKEKGLVPENLFDARVLPKLLKGFAPASQKDKGSVYYRAVLQNLFFATLNCEPDQRGWTREGQNMMAHSLYRHRDDFASAATALDLFKDIPFLNGGLFECLDKDLGEGAKPRYVRVDGFSRRDDSQPVVPDFLFFGPEQDADLSDFYEGKKSGKKPRPVRVRGLLEIFHDFKFTVEENTPLEEDVALDPELLGRVFENLLAAYNPETQVTARKQTGSFYTPREIVDYMTGQALFYSLREKVPGLSDLDARLIALLAHDDALNPFKPAETTKLIAALDELKILDPACGSGAFPMGMLHRMVQVLAKLDPGNTLWKKRQLDRLADIPDATVREHLAQEIEHAFGGNELGYGRKLYLIENCLYGVDIQPIAAQITKLRFFISLVVEQRTDANAPNRGVRPLPNLETKIVAANTLIGVQKQLVQFELGTDTGEAILEIDRCKGELAQVRHEYFNARTTRTKAKWRERDATLRARMTELLVQGAYSQKQARKLAAWDPYDQNASADFFDNEWMFGLTEGVDVVIGNPPYRMLQPHNTEKATLDYFREHYVSVDFKIELFHLFLQRGASILNEAGCLAFIVPSTLLNNVYAEKLRRWLMDRCVVQTIAVSPIRVFAEADVHTSVVVFRRETNPDKREKNIVATSIELTPQFARSPGLYGRILQARFAALPGAIWNILLNEENAGLFEKLRSTSSQLDSVSKINRGLITGDRERYFSERKLTEKHIPILTGSDVERYATKSPTEFVLFERPESAGGCWDEDVHLAPHKLVVRQIGTKPTASFLAKPIAVTGNIFTIRGENKRHELFILGILNSRLIEFFWKIMFSDFKSSFPQVTIFSLSQVPVVAAKESSEEYRTASDRVVSLVEKILAAKRVDGEGDTSVLEAEIDRHIYALYGLTPDEIKIVEGKAPETSKPALQPAAKLENWRAAPLKRPLHARQPLGDRYQPALVVELLAQAGLPVSFEVFRRAYWFLTQPDRLAAWAQSAVPQFGAKDWRGGFTESLPTGTFFAHLKAMIQQGHIKLRTLDGEVCFVEVTSQPTGIAHVVCDARLAILAAEARPVTDVVPALSVTEQKELTGLINAP